MDKKSKNIFFSLFTVTSSCSAQAMAIRIPLLPLPCYTLQGSFSFLGGLILSLNLSPLPSTWSTLFCMSGFLCLFYPFLLSQVFPGHSQLMLQPLPYLFPISFPALIFLLSTHCHLMYLLPLYIAPLPKWVSPSTRIWTPRGREIWWFYSSLYPLCLERCLNHIRWMTRWTWVLVTCMYVCVWGLSHPHLLTASYN